MLNIKPEIIRDEQDHPISVRIPYADWLIIESTLEIGERTVKPCLGIEKLRGTLSTLSMDPLEFQRSIRDEWG